jgi:hypothetical protein
MFSDDIFFSLVLFRFASILFFFLNSGKEEEENTKGAQLWETRARVMWRHRAGLTVHCQVETQGHQQQSEQMDGIRRRRQNIKSEKKRKSVITQLASYLLYQRNYIGNEPRKHHIS